MKVWTNNTKAYLLSLIIFILYSYTFFRNIPVSLAISALVSIKFKKIFFDYLESSRLNFQQRIFRDFLDLLNSSILSGQNFYQALAGSVDELEEYYNSKADLVAGLRSIKNDLDNGKGERLALKGFKDRCQIKEGKIFADTLIIALGSGMDLAKIVSASKDSINSQMDIEMEISHSLNNGKRELIIMIVLPLFILFLLTKTEITSLSMVDYIIRSVVFVMILFSIYFGEKIVNLEI